MFIWDFAANPIMDALLDWFYSQLVGFLGAFFAQMGNMGVELFELEWVKAVVLFFSQLGWALFGVSLVVSSFECGIEYASGRGNLQQAALNAIKGFLAVSLFTTVPVRLYALSVSLQGTFAAGLTGSGSGIGELGAAILQDMENASLTDIAASGVWGLSPNPVMLIFCIILMAYAVLKVFFSNLKRGGILLIQIAVGSLYMFSIPRGFIDGFVQWMKQVIGLCLTAFLQATILVAGLRGGNQERECHPQRKSRTGKANKQRDGGAGTERRYRSQQGRNDICSNAMKPAQNFLASLRGEVTLDVGNDKDQAAQQHSDFDDIVQKKLNAAAYSPTRIQPQSRQATADQSVQPLHS